MRSFTCFAVIAVAAAASLAAQESKPKKAPAAKIVSVTGCVTEDESTKNLTLADKTGTYKLSGLNVRDFLGQQVQLSGSIYESKKLVIRGGLVPSPNAAGQAGAIDQTQIANETHGGSAPTGDVQFPEFRVKSIRPLGTGCK
ncbi:MAG TPA: hypothetical protein VFA27_13485 [Vicinamibacterales bacterium]|nr:hypothetical protein [Vicinamibacterales bacterium]